MRKAVRRLAVCAASVGMAAQLFAAPVLAATGQPMGWRQENGAWKYYEAGAKAKRGWLMDGGSWYYMDGATAVMQSGWKKLENGKWYFFNPRSDGRMGSMLTGWQWIDGYCYYFFEADSPRYGEMAASEKTPDGYTVNADGRWVNADGMPVYESGRGISTVVQKSTAIHSKRSISGGGGGGKRSGRKSGGSSRRDNKPEKRQEGDKPQIEAEKLTPGRKQQENDQPQIEAEKLGEAKKSTPGNADKKDRSGQKPQKKTTPSDADKKKPEINPESPDGEIENDQKKERGSTNPIKRLAF